MNQIDDDPEIESAAVNRTGYCVTNGCISPDKS